MRVENLPLSLGFMQRVCNPKSCLHRLAVLSGPGEMLDAAGYAQLAVGDNLQLDEFTFYVLGVVEEIIEVAADRRGARVFQWRDEIIKHDIGFIEAAE